MPHVGICIYVIGGVNSRVSTHEELLDVFADVLGGVGQSRRWGGATSASMRSQESNVTAAGRENLQLSTRDEQLDVLAKVLSAGEDEAGIEVAPVGDDIARTKSTLAQRTTGNLAALSGAHGLTYMEVQF